MIRGDNPDKTFWSKQYLLGMVSEIDEVLNELNWKIHRYNRGTVDITNLGLELTDIFKYLISMYELWGLSEIDLMDLFAIKSEVVELQYDMEHKENPVGERILVCDLDGTLADWRSAFAAWVENYGFNGRDVLKTMHPDVDLGILYPEYTRMKEEFERSGWYGKLPVFQDVLDTVKHLQSNGVLLAFITARPSSSVKRVWSDTYHWLLSHGVFPDWLQVGSELRIVKALEWAKNNEVVLFEDNPELAVRASASGLKVFVKAHPYNAELETKHVERLQQFSPGIRYFSTGVTHEHTD